MKDCKWWLENNKIDHFKYRINMKMFVIHKWNELNVSYLYFTCRFIFKKLFKMNIKMLEQPTKQQRETRKVFDLTTDFCRIFKKKLVVFFNLILKDIFN